MRGICATRQHTSASNISGILSSEKVGGLLDKLPSGALGADQLKQVVTAKAWNALAPEEQDVVVGYLRAKGSIQECIGQQDERRPRAYDTQRRYIGKVGKVYADGSYVIQPN